MKCKNCSFVYVNPRPDQNEIQKYYPQVFYGETIDRKEVLNQQAESLKIKTNYINNLPVGKLLDVGCSKGEFMYTMRQRGWEVEGLDFSSKPPNLFDLDIKYNNLITANYLVNTYDLITFWAVLEHIYNPRQVVSEAHKILKPGGTTVIALTNFNSIPARFLQHDDIPRHVCLFTKSTLKSLLKKTGFIDIKFSFNTKLYGGWHRGILNYLVKLVAGEKLEGIVYQNRVEGQWHSFSGQINGRDSAWMRKIDQWDNKLYPYLDKIFDKLHLGFIMVATAKKPLGY